MSNSILPATSEHHMGTVHILATSTWEIHNQIQVSIEMSTPLWNHIQPFSPLLLQAKNFLERFYQTKDDPEGWNKMEIDK